MIDNNNILDEDKKHMFHKRPIFFMLFAEPSEEDIDNNFNLRKDDYGPVYLKLEFDKIYEMVDRVALLGHESVWLGLVEPDLGLHHSTSAGVNCLEGRFI